MIIVRRRARGGGSGSTGRTPTCSVAGDGEFHGGRQVEEGGGEPGDGAGGGDRVLRVRGRVRFDGGAGGEGRAGDGRADYEPARGDPASGARAVRGDPAGADHGRAVCVCAM